MLNKVCLIGNLGGDPEKRQFNNGGSVVGFRMATTERWNTRDGGKDERTEWHTISVYTDKLGEIVMRFLKKGSKVYVEGSISSRQYTDKQGNERTAYEIRVGFDGKLVMLDTKAEADARHREE